MCVSGKAQSQPKQYYLYLLTSRRWNTWSNIYFVLISSQTVESWNASSEHKHHHNCWRESMAGGFVPTSPNHFHGFWICERSSGGSWVATRILQDRISSKINLECMEPTRPRNHNDNLILDSPWKSIGDVSPPTMQGWMRKIVATAGLSGEQNRFQQNGGEC